MRRSGASDTFLRAALHAPIAKSLKHVTRMKRDTRIEDSRFSRVFARSSRLNINIAALSQKRPLFHDTEFLCYSPASIN